MFVSNDPSAPSVEVPVALTVLSSGGIEISASQITYTSQPVGLSESRTFSIQNVGNDTLLISNMYSSQSDFKIEENSFYMLPDEEKTINVVFSPSDVLVRSAELVIASNDVSDPEVTIDLTGTGLAPIFNVPPTVVDQIFSLPENSNTGYFVGQIVSKDLNFNSMTYSIEAGNEGEAYTMNNGGVLIVKKPSEFDFENEATHTLQVLVSDGELSTAIIITVNLEDVNETPTLSSQVFSVSENSAYGSEIGTIIGSEHLGNDVDGDVLSYAIVSGNSSNTFQLSNTGILKVSENINLNFEEKPSYELIVEVSDGQLSATTTIFISLEDVFELSSSKNLNEITLYPNPASSYLKIRNSQLISEVPVIDLSGKSVSVDLIFIGEIAELNIDHLIPGVYQLLIYEGEKRTIKLFINQ